MEVSSIIHLRGLLGSVRYVLQGFRAGVCILRTTPCGGKLLRELLPGSVGCFFIRSESPVFCEARCVGDLVHGAAAGCVKV